MQNTFIDQCTDTTKSDMDMHMQQGHMGHVNMHCYQLVSARKSCIQSRCDSQRVVNATEDGATMEASRACA